MLTEMIFFPLVALCVLLFLLALELVSHGILLWRWLVMPMTVEIQTRERGFDPGDHLLTNCPIDSQPRVFIVVSIKETSIAACHDTGINRLRLRLCGRPYLPTA